MILQKVSVIGVIQMNRLNILLQLSLAIIAANIFLACSISSENPEEDEIYFKPLDRIVYKKAGAGTFILTREGYTTRIDDELKDSLIQILRQQNKRLDEVSQHMNLLNKRENVNNSVDLLTTNGRISNEMLLEMVRDQNQRLNDVFEQLKLLSQNQNERHSRLIPRDEAVHVRQFSTQTVSESKHLTASLNYGKAIQLYQDGQYEKAIDAFEKLLNSRIEPKLADRYHFWMGVCYFYLFRGREAITEFSEVLRYTNSDKIEGAYFMIGQCFERIGAKKYAKMAFEKILQIYPQGNLKQITETKLALLK